MIKVLIGRIICFVTILLMVSGFSFSMKNTEVKEKSFCEIKKGSVFISNSQDLETDKFSEIEEVEEDSEKLEETISLLNEFDFCNNNICAVHLILESHNILSKNIESFLDFKKECKLPKWIHLRKILI